MNSTGQLLAYIRVSTVEQNEARQVKAITEYVNNLGSAKYPNKEIRWFSEKLSGKDTQRPELQALLDYAREGDTIIVKDFSRLSRSTQDLLALIEQLQAKNVEVISLQENLDTTSATGKLILTVIASINQFERQLMMERSREGIAIAKANGKYKGGTVKKTSDFANWDRLKREYDNREITKTKFAQDLKIIKTGKHGISRNTLNRLLKGDTPRND